MNLRLGGIAVLLTFAAPAFSQDHRPPIAEVSSYADLADLALAAPIVAQVRINKTWRIKGDEAVGLRAGYSRFLVEAEVERLISGRSGLPATIRYLVDIANGPSGRARRIKGLSAFVFLAGDPARPGQMRLVSRNAQIAVNPNTDARLRAILGEAQTPAGTTRITGIANAFYIPGAVPGESESQIFLSTADHRPVSLSVLRRPGETPRWSVALGEFVDEGAAAPARDTLLWYRLACSLPATLPSEALSDLSLDAAMAVAKDYRLVVEELGPCGRTTGDEAPAAGPVQ